VQDLMALPHLVRYFDPGQYTCAHNELPYVNSAGELKRIDRLVEFDTEVWVLDYKLTDSGHANTHDAQLREYQAAMQSVYSGKVVRCALIFADGGFTEVYPV
jgi:ATP-dependent helicase/nuclease subunit A